MTLIKCTLNSPLGSLLICAKAGFLCGLYTSEHSKYNEILADKTCKQVEINKSSVFMQATEQLQQYFKGELKNFTLPIKFSGTEFQEKVWSELSSIPCGKVVSYQLLAAKIGLPQASRAVGMANSKNPLSIIVPCHRVIRADGKLSGYAGGTPAKKLLLELEGAKPSLLALK